MRVTQFIQLTVAATILVAFTFDTAQAESHGQGVLKTEKKAFLKTFILDLFRKKDPNLEIQDAIVKFSEKYRECEQSTVSLKGMTDSQLKKEGFENGTYPSKYWLSVGGKNYSVCGYHNGRGNSGAKNSMSVDIAAVFKCERLKWDKCISIQAVEYPDSESTPTSHTICFQNAAQMVKWKDHLYKLIHSNACVPKV
eukprot:GFYU01029133.1.p1 GENE.GFYU01029133.1~~GFYU01029133.1.p1  ORF type:complete len:196 (+),score=30.20 GFYU01029133.1:116-703(+)